MPFVAAASSSMLEQPEQFWVSVCPVSLSASYALAYRSPNAAEFQVTMDPPSAVEE